MPKANLAKIFQNGRSQTVRLPKEFRFEGTEVRVSKVDKGVLLEPIISDPRQWFAELDRRDAEGTFLSVGHDQPVAPRRRTISMAQTAKLFRNGRSQAVRLPTSFRFEGSEVDIRRDEVTGDVILSRRPESWDGFFEFMKTVDVPEEFMSDRKDSVPQKRKLFR